MKRILTILSVLVLAFGARAAAQVKTGEASMNLNGTISAGYGDDTSNVAASDHSIYGAAAADFSGFYYNPNFLSFNVEPFYNQSRLNSTYASMTAASGVSASAAIFGGSHFPGSISYSSVFNGSGNYGIPGLANYTTHGDSDFLALNWGVRFKDRPSLNVNFSDGGSSYSTYGAEALGTVHEDTFSANSAYKIAGFSLNGGYQHVGAQAFTPEFLAGETSQQNNTGSNAFTAGIGHTLPWHGGFSASASHMNLAEAYTSSGSTTNYKTSIDTLTSGVNFGPLTHLNVGADAYYTDNLVGTLQNTLLASGVIAPETHPQLSSQALTLTGNANYVIPAEHITLHALMEREQQTLVGRTLASDMYNGDATYSNRLWGGQFTGVLGLTRTSVSTTSASLLGLNTSVSYSHSIRRWNVQGGFSYSQDTQTVLVGYTTSGYGYNGSLGRRIGRRSYWGAYASGERSLLTGEPGTANASQSYSTSFSIPRFSINGSYMRSSGNSLLTATGLVPTPIPVSVLPASAVVYFNGDSYSVGLSTSPVRGLTFTAGYAKALSTTNGSGSTSSNNNQNMYFVMTYRVRKLVFSAGYSNLVQGFSIVGTPQTRAASYYAGISRWFNFF
ncbi:MAG TPA: hypothetical protein VEO19_14235 [Terriglobia bacterium]|nr:hypothetical protein [Terriglobia bacterium]